MRISKYFLPVLKEDPTGAEVTSHKLMLRCGMIRQQNSGIYVWLPLGLKVLKKIENIVRNEINKIGALEVLMPCIQPAELWKESKRYDGYGKEMLRIKDRHNNDLLFGPTNEEVITDVFRSNISSYKELPKTFYQIQWKFRDEIRPRFGVMRGREFLMKDGYSFDIDEDSARKSYQNIFAAYISIFKRLGLNTIPVKADTGAIGGDLSHEFHIIANTGESDIFYDSAIDEEIQKNSPDIEKLQGLYAMADDMHKPDECKVSKDCLKYHKSIEVGHIFYFGTKYSLPLSAHFMDNNGQQVYPHSGSYGIGISRLVAAIIESSHDEKGIIWPSSVSPFDVSLLNLNIKESGCVDLCDIIYDKLQKLGLDVLYDDSSAGAGSKFSTHELIGIPEQVVLGPKLLKKGKIEIRNRANGVSQEIDVNSIDDFFASYFKR